MLRAVVDGVYNYGVVNVGQVEDLQGQESRVVIVSSVLTAFDGGSSEKKKKIGFMKDPFKFNVAVSRAQALLIVCGKMEFLEGKGEEEKNNEDVETYWKLLIEHCRQNNR